MVFTQVFDVPNNRQITLPNEAPTGKVNIVIYPVTENQSSKNAAMPLRNNGDFRLEGDFSKPLKKRVRGCVKGDYWMADDFCEPLEDFKDYM